MDVAPGVRGALLSALCRLEAPVTRRHLALLAGVAPGHASSVIDGLVQAGLVNEVIAGRSSMVDLNHLHLAAPGLLALAGQRSELIDRLRSRFGEMNDVQAAWLFGSVARGDATPTSDVDVLVIANSVDSPLFQAEVAELHEDIRVWTGNDLQLVEHTQETWDVLVASGNPLVGEIRRDGIALAPAASDWLGRAS